VGVGWLLVLDRARGVWTRGGLVVLFGVRAVRGCLVWQGGAAVMGGGCGVVGVRSGVCVDVFRGGAWVRRRPCVWYRLVGGVDERSCGGFSGVRGGCRVLVGVAEGSRGFGGWGWRTEGDRGRGRVGGCSWPVRWGGGGCVGRGSGRVLGVGWGGVGGGLLVAGLGVGCVVSVRVGGGA